MKQYRFPFLLLVIIAILGFYKYFYLNPTSHQVPAASGRPGVGSISVNAFLAKESKTINQLFLTGTAVANEEAQLVPEIAGKLVYLNIPEGRIVNQGELLARINDSELQASLKKLLAQSELFKEKSERNKKLLQINGISKEEYETSVTDYLSNQADIDLIKAQILKTEIRAPFSGSLGIKNISPGSYVSPGTVIASIQQLDPIKIEFYIPDKYLPLIKKGNPVTFKVEGMEESHEARIDLIEQKIDVNTRTVRIRANSNNRLHKILPGAFIKIELSLQDLSNSIMVPSEALIPILKAYKIYICKEGVAKEVKVQTGLRNESEVQILSGLQHGDTVITSGIMSLKDGSSIKITNLEGQ